MFMLIKLIFWPIYNLTNLKYFTDSHLFNIHIISNLQINFSLLLIFYIISTTYIFFTRNSFNKYLNMFFSENFELSQLQ